MKKLFTSALISLLALAVQSQTITMNSFTNSTGVGIPDGNPVGLAESFSVSGESGMITNIQISLDISGGFNGDLYAYLVSPQGQFSVLLNRVGVTASNPFGYANAGFNITLDGVASNNIHNYGSSPSLNGSGQVIGTWAADGLNIDPQSAGTVFSTTTPTAGLTVFNGVTGGGVNGTWTLFIADLSSGGGSTTLNQAILSIMTVPEPQPWTLALVGGGMVFLTGQLRRKLKK